MEFYARPDQLLKDHLAGVSDLCSKILMISGATSEEVKIGRIVGLIHDFGKYSKKFQGRMLDVIQGKTPRKAEHSGHGAALAFRFVERRDVALAMAFVVASHHSGLKSWLDVEKQIDRTWPEAERLLETAKIDFPSISEKLNWPKWKSDCPLKRGSRFEFSIRMLFSALIDADRLDAAGRESYDFYGFKPSIALDNLLRYIHEKALSVPEGPVKKARDRVLLDCLNAGRQKDRRLSLTVPTGGGKTLSSLAFALQRMRHDLNARRIILVTPYLSIIDQNAREYEKAIGKRWIVRHHSGLLDDDGPDDENGDVTLREKRRQATENWDAPIIVTTAVRFFEGLFSNRPGELRRFHNIANSIVIFDEFQTIPRKFLSPILSVLGEFSDFWKTTLLFSTATQPAIQKPLHSGSEDVRWDHGTVREINTDTWFISMNLLRVSTTGLDSESLKKIWSIKDISDEILKESSSVLTIVNTRDAARLLFESLRSNDPQKRRIFHLSTRLCGKHRLEVIDEIKESLSRGEPILVVSTQLVEAGVDFDFPVVFRSLAPLDSIAQAAGRCDREGRETMRLGKPGGRMVVFTPEDRFLGSRDYREQISVTKNIICKFNDLRQDIFLENTSHMECYFNSLYEGGRDVLDSCDIQGMRDKFDFKNISEKFRLIEDSLSVIVPYGLEGRDILDRARSEPLSRSFLSELQGFSVNLNAREFEALSSKISELKKDSNIWVLDEDDLYDASLGLQI